MRRISTPTLLTAAVATIAIIPGTAAASTTHTHHARTHAHRFNAHARHHRHRGHAARHHRARHATRTQTAQPVQTAQVHAQLLAQIAVLQRSAAQTSLWPDQLTATAPWLPQRPV